MITTLIVKNDVNDEFHVSARSLRAMLPFVLAWRANGLTYERKRAQPADLQLETVISPRDLTPVKRLGLSHTDASGVYWDGGIWMSWYSVFELASWLNIQPGKFAGTPIIR